MREHQSAKVIKTTDALAYTLISSTHLRLGKLDGRSIDWLAQCVCLRGTPLELRFIDCTLREAAAAAVLCHVLFGVLCVSQ